VHIETVDTCKYVRAHAVWAIGPSHVLHSCAVLAGPPRVPDTGDGDPVMLPFASPTRPVAHDVHVVEMLRGVRSDDVACLALQQAREAHATPLAAAPRNVAFEGDQRRCEDVSEDEVALVAIVVCRAAAIV